MQGGNNACLRCYPPREEGNNCTQPPFPPLPLAPFASMMMGMDTGHGLWGSQGVSGL